MTELSERERSTILSQLPHGLGEKVLHLIDQQAERIEWQRVRVHRCLDVLELHAPWTKFAHEAIEALGG